MNKQRFFNNVFGIRFTLIELLLVIAIIAILTSILLPALSRAREWSRQSVCSSNQKQLGLGLMMYTQDFDGYWPEFPQDNDEEWSRWDGLITSYVNYSRKNYSPALFYCPSQKGCRYSVGRTLSYYMNQWLCVGRVNASSPNYSVNLRVYAPGRKHQLTLLFEGQYWENRADGVGKNKDAGGYWGSQSWTWQYRHLNWMNFIRTDLSAGRTKSGLVGWGEKNIWNYRPDTRRYSQDGQWLLNPQS